MHSCFIYAGSLHSSEPFERIAKATFFPHLKEIGVCRIAMVPNIRGILNLNANSLLDPEFPRCL